MKTKLTTAVALAGALTAATSFADSIPSVVVTVENSAPSRGTLLTPVWVGFHDGTFDIYDRNVALGADGLVPSPAVERLAEDGNTGPISTEFEIAQPGASQATLVARTLSNDMAGPLAPGQRSAMTFNVDPQLDRYFSYASMIIPSNDFFIANGNPLAHEIFDDRGRFVADDFAVAGSEVLDAGTEVNDEIASNTAFLNQGGPDIGVEENGLVVLASDSSTGGFQAPGTVSFPDGVLNHPVFAFGNFNAPTYRAADVSFRYVDLGRTNLYVSRLTTDQEVAGPEVDSDARGAAVAISRQGNRAFIRIAASRLSGPIEMAHLHLGPAGANGPVVVNLGDGIRGKRVFASFDASDLVGPFAGEDFVTLLNEMAAGNIYINLHTAANPAGELRGQVKLR